MTEQQKLKKATYHLYTFFLSKLIGGLGSTVYTFGISMYVLAMTSSAFYFSMVMLCGILTNTILSPIAGVVGDRVNRKMLVIGGQAGYVVTMVALTIFTITNGLSMPAIYVATVFTAGFTAFSGIAFSSSLANLIDEPRLQKAISFNQMAASSAGIGGPIVGGMLFGFASIEVFLIIFAVTSTIVLLLECTINYNLYKKEPVASVKTEENQAPKKPSMFTSFKEGFTYIKTKPILMALLSTTFGLNFFFTCLSVGGDFTLVTILKMPTQQIGFTEAASAVGVILASIYFASTAQVKDPLRLSKYFILVMSVLVMLASVPLFLNMNLLGNFIYFLVLMFAFGVSNVATNMPIGVLFQTMVSDEYRSRVFGILNMISMSLMPLAMLIYGILFDLVPAQYLFIGSGLCLIVLTLYTLKSSVLKMGREEADRIRAQAKAAPEATQNKEMTDPSLQTAGNV